MIFLFNFFFFFSLGGIFLNPSENFPPCFITNLEKPKKEKGEKKKNNPQRPPSPLKKNP